MIQWNGQQVIDEVHLRIRHNMIQLAQAVVFKAQQLAPRKSGDLERSIDYDWNDENFTVVFTVGVDYGMFQEYGTRNIRPHPYLRPALNWVGPQYGFNFEFSFTNTAQTDTKLLAHGDTFQMHKSLTAKQKAHVRQHLKPVSAYHWYHRSGNVSQTRVHARRREF